MSITHEDVADLLTHFFEAYGGAAPTEQTVGVWLQALESITGDEARAAAYTLLENRERRPAPADVLRLAREQRASTAAKLAPNATGTIPLQDAAKRILADLEQRMRAGGKIRTSVAKD